MLRDPLGYVDVTVGATPLESVAAGKLVVRAPDDATQPRVRGGPAASLALVRWPPPHSPRGATGGGGGGGGGGGDGPIEIFNGGKLPPLCVARCSTRRE